MSLVNDVLRDLEKQPKTAPLNLDINAVPLPPSFYVTTWVRGALIVSIVVVLLLIVWKTLFNQQPLSSTVSPAAHLSAILNTEEEKPEVVSLERPKESAINSVSSMAESTTTEVVPEIEESTKNESIQVADIPEPIKQIEVVKPIAASKPQKVQEKPIRINHQAKVIPTSVGREEYQLAIKAYQAGQLRDALNWTEQAISHSQRDEYIVMKARILMDQKNRDGFLSWVNKNPNVKHENWTRLVAPGLQILGFYDESNRYYQRLIESAPDNIQWRLAAALNYSRMGDVEKTKAIYQSLINSPYSNPKQKAWLHGQVKRIDKQQS